MRICWIVHAGSSGLYVQSQGHGAQGTCCVVLEGKQRVVMDTVGAVCDSIVYDHDLSVSRSRNPALQGHDVSHICTPHRVTSHRVSQSRYAAPSQSSRRLTRWFAEVLFMVLWWILIPVLLMFGVAIFVRRSRGKTPGIPGGLVKVVHREGPTCLSVRLATRECLLHVVSNVIFRLTGVM